MAWGIFWAIGIVCAVWVIYDVFVNQKKYNTERKVLWTVAAIVLSILTAIVYYFFVKRK